MDLNSDGKMDIVSGSYPGEIYFFRKKPNNTYAAPVTLKTAAGAPVKVGNAAAVAVVDWDGDGKLDLIVGNMEGDVFFIPNVGTREKPVFGRSEPLKVAGRPISPGRLAGPCVADWDGIGGYGKRELEIFAGAEGALMRQLLPDFVDAVGMLSLFLQTVELHANLAREQGVVGRERGHAIYCLARRKRVAIENKFQLPFADSKHH